MTETMPVPVELVRAATACLKAAPSTAAAHAAERLALLLRDHESPDLFAPPAVPTRDIIEHHLPPMRTTSSPTARAMRAKVWPTTGTYRMAMLRTIAAAGDRGMADFEIERAMSRTHQSVSATRNGLVNDGWLEPALHGNGAPIERTNEFANPCQVWRPTTTALRRLAAPSPTSG